MFLVIAATHSRQQGQTPGHLLAGPEFWGRKVIVQISSSCSPQIMMISLMYEGGAGLRGALDWSLQVLQRI